MASGERRVALVTGGAKRVGRAVVERLAVAGFDVAFTYLSSEREANELAKQIDGTAIRADLTDPTSAITSLGTALKRNTRLDVLVNSASLYEPSSLTTTNVEQVRRLSAIHIESPLLLCQRF